LNKPEQTKNTTALKELASISTSHHVYKQLRPSDILKVEKLVKETTRVLEEEYLNPFCETNGDTLLYNLSPGTSIPNEIADDILNLYSEGPSQMNDFKKRSIQADDDQSTDNHVLNIKKFHDPISRNNIKSFKNTCQVVKKGDIMTTVAVNRDIIGSLLSF